MIVKYTQKNPYYHWNLKSPPEFEEVTESLDYFTVGSIFGEGPGREGLERQPLLLAQAFGRLLDVLANKGIVGKDELVHILESQIDFSLEKE